jgi:hypothetical protein
MNYRTQAENEKLIREAGPTPSSHLKGVTVSDKKSVSDLSGIALDRAVFDATPDQQMVAIKTRLLEGEALNAVVAICLDRQLVNFSDMFRSNGAKAGKDPAHVERLLEYQTMKDKWVMFESGVAGALPLPDYAGDHALSGPLLDRERISTVIKHDGWWQAMQYDVNDDMCHLSLGRTRLEAGLRCFVESKLGPSFEMRATQAKCLGFEGRPAKASKGPSL